ncbi:MAG: hypothetical protein ISR65_15730 [Bacteriovoracaceae bacterium]|nr:hypothetical protein [Bacteriovoracaceae bacterium]
MFHRRKKAIILALLLALTTNLWANPQGIWSFSGIHSELGAYSGELEVRQAGSGEVSLVRVVTYEDFRYKNFKIQEIWSGRGHFENSHLRAHFKIKQADYIHKVNELTHTPEQFKEAINLTASFELKRDSTVSWNLLKNTEVDHFDGQMRKLEQNPLWKSKRKRIYSKGEATSVAQYIAKLFMVNTVVAWYRKDPKVAAYSHRLDFQDEAQYFITDSTDYDFYQQQGDTLRIPNKIIDEISLVEELYRRDAYAPSLSQKANIADSDMQKMHINEAGLLAAARVDEQGELVSFIHDNDGALWSGMYAGSQAMRYLVTKDQQALKNFRRTLKGMILLMDITADPHQFARTIEAFDPKDPLDKNPWHRGLGEYNNFSWKCCGNNDMLKGIFHAFAWASVVLPQDDELRSVLAKRSRLLPELKVVKEAKQNVMTANGLAALWTGEASFRKKYLYGESFLESVAERLGVAQGFYIGGISDWSGINLGVVGLSTLILTTEEMINKFPTSKIRIFGKITEVDILKKAREAFLDKWYTYAKTKRDLVTIAAYTFAYKAGDHRFGRKKRKLWDQTLSQAVWSLRDFSFPQHRYNVAIDFSLRPSWCLSAWPRLPWKSIKKRQPVEYHFQAVEDFPLFQSLIFDTNFYWKDGPFSIKASGTALVKQPRADYLYAYWMARWSGLLTQDNKWLPEL